MLKSMTGFGRGEYEDESFSITVEMKTVNHRYNEVAIRLPRFLNPLEDKIRKTILKTVNRGRIDVFINADYTSSDNCTLKVDKNLAAAYHKALQEVGAAIGADNVAINGAVELLHIARCPEVINVKEGFFDVEAVWPKVEQAVNQAVANLVAMRETEGGNIYGDFIYRADLIAAKLAEIEERSPKVVEEYQAKLSERLNNLLEEHNIAVEPERLLQEVAIFADRTSITEEIVRLKSHIKQFKTIIASDQPVGRKLDFLIQEFNREANTIASKANDYTLAQIVVDVKAEIEKIREQIQNIE
ncbi:MAG: YicC family protein [Phascolarctobacterium sp.]|nr:YicC family protein [Phascolarctobacterium sp.]